MRRTYELSIISVNTIRAVIGTKCVTDELLNKTFELVMCPKIGLFTVTISGVHH